MIEAWQRNIPKYIVVDRMKLEVVLLGTEEVADVTDSLKFTINGKVMSITYPGIRDGMMTIGRNEYIGIVQLRRPPITNIGTGVGKVVVLHSLSTEARWWVPRGETYPACRWSGRYFHRTIDTRGIRAFTGFPLRPEDRTWIRKRGGGEDEYIVREDLIYIYSLFQGTEWNWKYLGDMRAMSVQDSFLCHLGSRLRWISRPTTENEEVQRAMDRFWTGNPQIQWVDPNMSDLALVALRAKIHFPIGAWDPLEDALPDPSWVGLVDSLTTPQSSKAGSIISLTDSAEVRDGRIVWKVT